MRSKRVPAFFASPVADGSAERAPLAAVALLVAAVLLGGGHIHGPIRNGLIEAVAAALLVALTWRQVRSAALPATARGPVALFAALLLLILFQMLPLPWPTGLSGREMTDVVLALPGVERHWRALSLDPAATARFAASLLVPLAAALATIAAGPRGRLILIRCISLLAALSAVVATVQLALGYPGWASPFGMPDPGFADGLFVNRNHQAMFLLSGLLATGLWIRLEGPGSKSVLRLTFGRWRVHAAWLCMPLLALMTVAAGSRAGIGLLLVILPAAIALALGKHRGGSRFGISPRLVPLVIVLLIGLIIFAAVPSETMSNVRARFVFGGDARIDFLPDVLLLIGQYRPWGSGFGTFVPVYSGIEDLDRLGPAYLNHAHNEFLEWLVEGGIAAGVMIVAALALFSVRLWLVLASSRSGSRKALAVTGAGILTLLGAHSVIDYPLRTDALAALAGVAIGLLFTPALEPTIASGPPPESRSRTKRLLPLALLALLVALLGAQIMRLRLAEAAAGNADAGLAAMVRSHDGMANAYVAEATLARGDAALARREALAAIDQSPLSIVAVRTLAMANQKLGDWPGERAAWRAAAGMGWRDIPTQYWAMQQALADGEMAKAGHRADAVLRLNSGTGPFATLMRGALANPALRAGLAPRVALRPSWRTHLFNSPTPLTDPEIAGLLPTLREVQRSGAPPTRGEARQLMYSLLAKRRWSDAIELDQFFAKFRKRDPGSLLDDGGFDRPAQAYRIDATPFDWMIGIVGSSNVADLDEAPPKAMVITTDGSMDAASLTRWVPLGPGRYRISFTMRGAAESPSALGVTAICGDRRVGRSATNNLAGDGFQQRRFQFDIAADCPVLLINVGGFGGGSYSEAEFDDFRLTPVMAGPNTAARR